MAGKDEGDKFHDYVEQVMKKRKADEKYRKIPSKSITGLARKVEELEGATLTATEMRIAMNTKWSAGDTVVMSPSHEKMLVSAANSTAGSLTVTRGVSAGGYYPPGTYPPGVAMPMSPMAAPVPDPGADRLAELEKKVDKILDILEAWLPELA